MNKSKIIICKYSIILMNTITKILIVIIIVLVVLIAYYSSTKDAVDKTSKEIYNENRNIVIGLGIGLASILVLGIGYNFVSLKKSHNLKQISVGKSSDFICYIWFGLIYSVVIMGIIYFISKAAGYMKANKTFPKITNADQISDIIIKWGDTERVSLDQSNVEFVKKYIENKHFTS